MIELVTILKHTQRGTALWQFWTKVFFFPDRCECQQTYKSSQCFLDLFLEYEQRTQYVRIRLRSIVSNSDNEWGGEYSQQSIRDEAQGPTSHGWMCLLTYVCGHYQQDCPGPVTAAVTPHELQIKNWQREKKKHSEGPLLHKAQCQQPMCLFQRYRRPQMPSPLTTSLWLLDIFILALTKSSLLWSPVKPSLMKEVGLILLLLKYEQLVVITAVFQIKGCAGNYQHYKIQTLAAWAADCEMEKNSLWLW